MDRLLGDRYRLEALVGKGGMGEVWRAQHAALGTRVAVKLLHAGSSVSERARRRFLTEAQVTANLRTRHAVQVFDFGVAADGRPYLVMELLEGETLDRRIAREGRLGVHATAAILEQAARALERAHSLGIVHRDFKPENVMLVPDEERGGELVKVVDFGIAKLVGDLEDNLKGALAAIAASRRAPDAAPVEALGVATSGSAGAKPLNEITSVGVGTPFYMAPEQVRESAQIGPAADIWAFGVVAYECLTGRRPFDGGSIGELLRRILAAEMPPPARCYAPVPDAFDAWFRVACAREPAARFPDLRAAEAALHEALHEPAPASLRRVSVPDRREASPLASSISPPPCPPAPPLPAPSPPPPTRSRRPARRIPIFVAIALVASVVAVVTVHRGHPVAQVAPSYAAPAPVEPPAVVLPPVVVEPSAAPPAPPDASAPPAPSARSPRAPRRPKAYTLPPLGL